MRQEELLEKVLGDTIEYFPTGSRVWGVANRRSDFDYVIDIDFRRIIMDKLLHLKTRIEHSDYNMSIKVECSKREVVNFIFVHPTELLVWRDATLILKGMAKRSTIISDNLEDKSRRIALFHTAKALITQALSGHPDLDRRDS